MLTIIDNVGNVLINNGNNYKKKTLLYYINMYKFLYVFI